TPSGYRKFYETDVERLRWILRQQRENFLPLKVIKGRLRGDPDGGEGAADDPAEGEGEPGRPLAQAGGAVPTGDPAPLVAHTSGANLNLAELASASGLDEDDLRELERFDILAGRRVGSNVYYDE